MVAKNPPSFILVDRASGEVVYTKRATGVGSEAIRKCVERGRTLANKTGRTYFVYLDIMGARVGMKMNVQMAYVLGITEEIGPTDRSPARRCCSAPELVQSGQGVNCLNCQKWTGGSSARSNPRHVCDDDCRSYGCSTRRGPRRNIFTFNNPVSGPADQDAARELELYIENDADLYRQQFVPIVKNLMLKRRKGIYRNDLAKKLFMYLMDAGAKKYVREFGTAGQKIDAMFNRNTRMLAANHFVFSFENEAELGNYDRMIGPVSNPRGVRKNIFTFNNPKQRPHNEMERAAGLVGLSVATWAPGDGVTRYRFFKATGKARYADYHQGGAIYTANGRGEAMKFLQAYGVGRSRMNPLNRSEVAHAARVARRYQDISRRAKPFNREAAAEAAGVSVGMGSAVALFGEKQYKHLGRKIIHRTAEMELGLRKNPSACSSPVCKNPKHGHAKSCGHDNGFYVMTYGGGRFTSVGWSKTRAEAQKEVDSLMMRGSWSGMPPRVEAADCMKCRGMGRVLPNPLLQTIMLANPGSAKTFNEMQDVGKAKYVVNYHDGVKTHRDGSPFFDIAIFSSRTKKDRFVRKLESLGFTRGSFRNPPISAQWDRLTGRQRLQILGFVGFEDTANRYVRQPWNLLSSMVKQALEQYWNDTSATRGTTRRRMAPVGVNPLTRQESANIINDARDDIGHAKVFVPGPTRASYAGRAIGRAQVVEKYGPKSIKRTTTQRTIAKAVALAHGASSVHPNPGGLRLPAPGTKMTVAQAMELARRIGDRDLIQQCKEAAALQGKANAHAKSVTWKHLPMGSKDKIDSVVALAHYGESPETMYKPPKGSKKGNHMYRHTWSEGKRVKKPVPILVAPGGKMMIQTMNAGQKIGDWMRG